MRELLSRAVPPVLVPPLQSGLFSAVESEARVRAFFLTSYSIGGGILEYCVKCVKCTKWFYLHCLEPHSERLPRLSSNEKL